MGKVSMKRSALFAAGGDRCVEAVRGREEIPDDTAGLGRGRSGAGHRDPRGAGRVGNRAEFELGVADRDRIAKAIRRKGSIDLAVK